jgi:hypothetical protein
VLCVSIFSGIVECVYFYAETFGNGPPFEENNYLMSCQMFGRIVEFQKHPV